MAIFKNSFLFSCIVLGLFIYCNPKQTFFSPAGYDLTKPDKIKLPYILNEISGISFKKGNSDTIYAIEDEFGRLYKYVLSTKTLTRSRFYEQGDYEDVTIDSDSAVIVLKSNGTLFSFPISASVKENIENVAIIKDLFPIGEYEGLFAKDNKWFVMCKHCKDIDAKREIMIYEVQPSKGNKAAIVIPIKINFSKVRKEANSQKESFHPSGIAFQPITHEWYILSAVNDILLILDEHWVAKTEYALDPSVFKQPEGIAFNEKGDLFISNEALGGTANILRFNYLGLSKK